MLLEFNDYLAYLIITMSSKKCRTCLKDNDIIINIFKGQDSEILSSQIMSLTRLNISPNDGLPDIICDKCLAKLKLCIEFVDQCKKSDLELRIKKQKSNDSQEETTINNSKNNAIPNESSGSVVLKSSSNCSVKEDDKTVKKIDTDLFIQKNQLKCEYEKIQKHQCSICGKVLSTRFRLKTHVATHSKEQPFSCEYCEKKFAILQNLHVHLRTHTGEKPLECSVCGKKFAQSSGLSVHKRKHNGLMPYKCALCPRSFRTIGHLHYHVRVHTGEKNFECNTCGRAFITRSDLKTHQLTHTGEKPHVCSICGMRLSRISNLRRHIRYSHKKDKLFSCLQCPLKFLFQSELKRHKTKHKEKINDF